MPPLPYLSSMSANQFGRYLTITTSGESHGKTMGVIIDGCPSGIHLTQEMFDTAMARRRPGQSAITTPRHEKDQVQIMAGILDNVTLGSPILLLIPNEDLRSNDYSHIESAYRPSHADFVYEKKYGLRDSRGGGRSSARETTNWVAAGVVANAILSKWSSIKIHAGVTSVGTLHSNKEVHQLDWEDVENNIIRSADRELTNSFLDAIEQIKKEGDTIGGCITCFVENCPIGLGDPVFHKLEADLAHAMLNINASKGFEIGSGFSGSAMKGSQHNDLWEYADNKYTTRTNHSGGIQGGITNGMPLYFRIAFKPVSTLMKSQESVDSKGNKVLLEGKGRHDPCVLPRAVPVVQAMTALVLADHLLAYRMYENR